MVELLFGFTLGTLLGVALMAGFVVGPGRRREIELQRRVDKFLDMFEGDVSQLMNRRLNPMGGLVQSRPSQGELR
jgi:hypothetical protein